jgi:hypothetical protein
MHLDRLYTLELLDLFSTKNNPKVNILARLIEYQTSAAETTEKCPVQTLAKSEPEELRKTIRNAEILAERMSMDGTKSEKWDKLNRVIRTEKEKMSALSEEERQNKRLSKMHRGIAKLVEDYSALEKAYELDVARTLITIPDIERFYQYPESRYRVLKMVVDPERGSKRNDSPGSAFSGSEQFREGSRKRPRLAHDQVHQESARADMQDGITTHLFEQEQAGGEIDTQRSITTRNDISLTAPTVNSIERHQTNASLNRVPPSWHEQGAVNGPASSQTVEWTVDQSASAPVVQGWVAVHSVEHQQPRIHERDASAREGWVDGDARADTIHPLANTTHPSQGQYMQAGRQQNRAKILPAQQHLSAPDEVFVCPRPDQSDRVITYSMEPTRALSLLCSMLGNAPKPFDMKKLWHYYALPTEALKWLPVVKGWCEEAGVDGRYRSLESVILAMPTCACMEHSYLLTAAFTVQGL